MHVFIGGEMCVKVLLHRVIWFTVSYRGILVLINGTKCELIEDAIVN